MSLVVRENWPRARGHLTAIACLAVMVTSMGCGAPQLVLKGPLSDKCAETGLKGCPQLVDGVLDYVDGNKAEGTQKLKRAAAENAPDKVQDFAAMMQPLLRLPGVDSYAGPIKEVIDLLASGAQSRVHKAPPSDAPEIRNYIADHGTAASDAGRAGTADPGDTRAASPAMSTRFPASIAASGSTVDVKRLRTKTVIPAIDERSVACVGPTAVVRAGGACSRVSMFNGPFVLTDLYIPGGCGDDLFVVVDGEGTRGWILYDAASGALNVHGTQLLVEPDQKLYVGARTEKGPLRGDPLRCSVTLSGWMAPFDAFE